MISISQRRRLSPSMVALVLTLSATSVVAASGQGAQNKAETAKEKVTMPQQLNSTGPVKLNEEAPDFELPSETGDKVRLSDFRGKKAVVVYFYPKDETPGCTAESCAFRDAYEDFKDARAEVIGISSDSIDSHRNFAQKHKLPFILLSDTGGKLRAAWGVPSTLGIMPGRVTYVIDKKGIVRSIFNSQLDVQKHVAEAKKILATIKAE